MHNIFGKQPRPFRRDRLRLHFLRLYVCCKVKQIVHGMPEILLAAEITFRRLDGCMSQQELNLLQLAPT
jgi:hypothetical protein